MLSKLQAWKRLTDIKLFDVFSGEKLGLGMKSMAYSLTFQNPEDSLTDEEVARYMEKNPSITWKKSQCRACVKVPIHPSGWIFAFQITIQDQK